MKSVMKDGEDIIDSTRNTKSSSFIEEANDFSKEQTGGTQLVGSRIRGERERELGRSNSNSSYTTLKESIGHTEVEVIGGALLGFLVTLTVYALM